MPQFAARIIARRPYGPTPKQAPPVSRSRWRTTGVYRGVVTAASKRDARRKVRSEYPSPQYAIGRITPIDP